MAKHRITAARLPVDVLEADPQTGLTREQAAYRLRRGWSNRTSRKTDTTVWQILRKHCFTYFNLIFAVMAVVMLLVGASVLNLTFMVIVTVNACIGCFQELRAKRAVDKLALVAAQTLLTVRDGELVSVPSDRLVRDDIVEFHAGDQICADATVCTGSLLVNEALITGETDPVEKNPGDALRSGSFVVTGVSRCRLTGVGDDGYAARLSAEAKKQPAAAKSEMMRSLDRLIRFIGFALIPMGLALFFSQMRSDGFTLQGGVEATVAALVGLIPEGLFLLTSIALAVSALKLTKNRVLIQHMNCIETLARVDVLCVDKTGTITEPGMELSETVPLDKNTDLAPVLTAIFGGQPAEMPQARPCDPLFPEKPIGFWNIPSPLPPKPNGPALCSGSTAHFLPAHRRCCWVRVLSNCTAGFSPCMKPAAGYCWWQAMTAAWRSWITPRSSHWRCWCCKTVSAPKPPPPLPISPSKGLP